MTYLLLDSGHFKKLEQIGPYKVIRPSLPAIWEPMGGEDWELADAVFSSKNQDRGQWVFHNQQMAPVIPITMEGIHFELKLTPFGHLGLFPEQANNWKRLKQIIDGRSLHVLNLFAYTGGASVACALAGARVTHVDASKNTIDWARRHAHLSGLERGSIRWIVDDVCQFVNREGRRGKVYDAVILDPPSFGRGPKGQVWKIEDDLIPLLKNIKKLLHSCTQFVLLSCHSAGYTCVGLENILQSFWGEPFYKLHSQEMKLQDRHLRHLPSGVCCWVVTNPLTKVPSLP